MENVGIKNYFKIRKWSMRYDYYAFVDTADYLADSLFIKKRVRVRFGKEMKHPKEAYMVIFCKVLKNDSDRFVEALSELSNKMILCGHADYEAFCKEISQLMEKGVTAMRQKRRDPDEICAAGETE